MLRWSFIIAILFLFGCKSVNQITQDNHLLFSIEKGPCFGACPEYKIEVFTNGEAHLKGIRNVEHVGEFKKQLPAEFIQEIANSIKALDIAALDSNYVNEYLTDFPATDLGFDINGVQKRIHVFHESPPQRIQKVMDVINGYENRIKWDFSTQSNQ
ncbi:MAG: hypothetical protein RL516_1227 [Bacteroidota bacterium]|jgi:hypothetical protein